jgi:AraC family transcriptional regulator, arabinose operon regulatory protein
METIQKRDGFVGEKFIVVPTDFFKTCQDHPLVKPLFATDIGYFPRAVHHYRERRAGCDENILIYCVEGSGYIEVTQTKYCLSAGDAFCIPAQSAHRYYADADNPWTILWVHFKGDACDLYPYREDKKIHIHTPQENNGIQLLFSLLIEVLECNYTVGNFIHASQLLAAILSNLYFKEKSQDQNRPNLHLTKAIRYLYSSLHKDLSLDDLSSRMNVSKSYLNKLFKIHTKHAPMDFFVQLKMQQACKYLKMSDLLVYEIAEKVGYQDQCYFSRVFKKIVGITPGEYRNN